MNKKIRVRVPATITDIGPCVNFINLAVSLYNYITIEETDSDGIEMINLNEAKNLTKDDISSLKHIIDDFLFKKLDYKIKKGGLKVTNDFNVPLRRGLNSLTIAKIGLLIAASVLADEEIFSDDLLSIMKDYIELPEKFVSTVIGGIVITSPYNDTFIAHRLEFPKELKITLIIPEYEIKPIDLTSILNKPVNINDAIFNSSRVALLISSLCQKKFDFLNLALEDKIFQKYLNRKIPGREEISLIAKSCKKFGISMCSGGSTILVFHTEPCDDVISRIEKIYLSHKIKSNVVTVSIDEYGGSMC